MYEQFKRHAPLLAVAAALTAVTLAALPGVAEAQDEGAHEEGLSSTPRPATDTPTTKVLVTPGDSLWTIAQEHLGPDATPQLVANEVGRIFELNRDRIGDNPDLIFPGQQLSLSPVSGLSGHVSETDAGVVDAPVATAAEKLPATEKQPAAEERPPAAGRDVRQTDHPKQLPEASPTKQDGSTVQGLEGSLPDVDTQQQRRLLGIGLLALTLLLAILMLWRLPMRRNTQSPEAWRTYSRYADYHVAPNTFDASADASRTAAIGSPDHGWTLGASKTDAPAKGPGVERVDSGLATGLAASGRRKRILRARAPDTRKLRRLKRHSADVYSPQVRGFLRRVPKTRRRRAATAKKGWGNGGGR